MESSTRLTPMSPASAATCWDTRKMRSGSVELRSRARMFTSTVWSKPSVKPSTPAAYFQRRSKVKRSTASRSEQDSNFSSTMTVATTLGGIERRPRSANRSANISSGKSWSRSRCSSE